MRHRTATARVLTLVALGLTVFTACGSSTPAGDAARVIEATEGDVVATLAFSASSLPDGVSADDPSITVSAADIEQDASGARSAAIVIALAPDGLAFAEPAALTLRHPAMRSVIAAGLVSGDNYEPIVIPVPQEPSEQPAVTDGLLVQIPLGHFSDVVLRVSDHAIIPRLLEGPTSPVPVGGTFALRVAVDHLDWALESGRGTVDVEVQGSNPLTLKFLNARATPTGDVWAIAWRWRQSDARDVRGLSPAIPFGVIFEIPTAQSGLAETTMECIRPGEFVLSFTGTAYEDGLLQIFPTSDNSGDPVLEVPIHSSLAAGPLLVFGECVGVPGSTPTAGLQQSEGASPTPALSGETVGVDVVVVNGERVPTEQLDPSGPHAGCGEWHWHLTGTALTLEGGEVTDPAASGCGLGTYLQIVNVAVPVETWEHYRNRLAGLE